MKFFKTFSILLITLIVVSCGSKKKKYVKSPLDVIVTTYIDQQNYSVILADMNYEENNDSYFHKYRIVIPKTATPTGSENDFEIINTEWKKVTALVFDQHQNDLGMTVLSKKNGVLDKKTAPAGYDNYVGNEKYGQWQTSSNGTSFWAFYGQYAFMRSMLGWGSGYRYYRDDYNYYNSYRGRQNYYGRNNSFGTNNYKSNTSTWANKPQSFKQNVQSKVKKSAATLKSKSYSSGSSYGNSSQKTTRSTSRYSNSSSSRSRSGGFGK